MLSANTLHVQCKVFFCYSYFAYLSLGQVIIIYPSATVSHHYEVVTNAPAPFLYIIIQ